MKIVRFNDRGRMFFGVFNGDNCAGDIQKIIGNPLGNFNIADIAIPSSQVSLTYPCSPGKIIGVAINYKKATGLIEGMKEPLVFLKSPNCLIGPGDKILAPFSDINIWGESELVVVIKKRLINATQSEAREGVLGYSIGNDVSANNINDWDHHLARSKAADTFCSLGPWIDTQFDPSGKTIEAWHNDVLIRHGSLDDMLWNPIELVVWLSSWMTLEPWDIILTGTPPRVISRIYFKEGDEFRCCIEGLGELRNGFSVKKKRLETGVKNQNI